MKRLFYKNFERLKPVDTTGFQEYAMP